MIDPKPSKELAMNSRERLRMCQKGPGSPRRKRMTEKAAETAGGSKGDAKPPYQADLCRG